MPWISSNWTALSFENRVIAWLTGIWLLVVFIHLINTLREIKEERRLRPENAYPFAYWQVFTASFISSALFLAGIAVVIIGVNSLIDLAVQHPEQVLNLTSAPYTIVVGILAGVIFFLLRCRNPLVYGITEVGVGIASISASANPNVNNRVLTLLGGIYILVRGLDNMDKRLKDQRVWNRVFWGKAATSPN